MGRGVGPTQSADSRSERKVQESSRLERTASVRTLLQEPGLFLVSSHLRQRIDTVPEWNPRLNGSKDR